MLAQVELEILMKKLDLKSKLNLYKKRKTIKTIK